jgi:hypothetical protein
MKRVVMILNMGFLVKSIVRMSLGLKSSQSFKEECLKSGWPAIFLAFPWAYFYTS